MDNKDAIDGLKFIKLFYSNKKRDTSLSDFDIEALDKAIASLEAWDKVTDELEEYKITGSQMECFGTTEENAKEYIPIDTALDIINKHLGE